MTTQPMQVRRDTAANWTSLNPVPLSGEWCKETDTGKLKQGDGVTSWTSLAYAPAGSVTSASVVSANGFAGTVATQSSTPAITLSTTVTGVLKGNGTAVSAAAAGTDYLAPNGSGAALTGITAAQVGADASGAAAAVSSAVAAELGQPSGIATLDGSGKLAQPLESTAVTPGSYTSANLTVGADGRLTAASNGAGGGVASFNSRAGAVTPQSGDYSVGQVTGAAPLASPALTGTPTAPTQAAGDTSTAIATDAFAAAAAAASAAYFLRVFAV